MSALLAEEPGAGTVAGELGCGAVFGELVEEGAVYEVGEDVPEPEPPQDAASAPAMTQQATAGVATPRISPNVPERARLEPSRAHCRSGRRREVACQGPRRLQ